MKITFYQTNRAPVLDFIKALDTKERAHVLACLKSVEELGIDSPRVQFRQIKGKLWEIKIRGTQAGYRIFYVMLHSETLVLLHAYKKESQKAPKKEIELAEKRMLEVLHHEHDYIN